MVNYFQILLSLRYVHQDDGLHEKVLFIGLEDDSYHLESEDLCPCDKSSWQKDLSLCFSGEMISEGANVLLMRYLALKNFHGDLSFQSIMIDGQLTTCNYVRILHTFNFRCLIR